MTAREVFSALDHTIHRSVLEETYSELAWAWAASLPILSARWRLQCIRAFRFMSYHEASTVAVTFTLALSLRAATAPAATPSIVVAASSSTTTSATAPTFGAFPHSGSSFFGLLSWWIARGGVLPLAGSLISGIVSDREW